MPRNIERYAQESQRQCQLMIDLLDQRKQCEEAYAKSLHQIVSTFESFAPLDDPETDPISATLYSSSIWKAIKNVFGNLDKISESHLKLSLAIQKDVLEPYRDMVKEFEEKKTEQVGTCQQINQNLNEAAQSLQQTKLDLESARQDASQASEQLLKAQHETSSVKRKDMDKLITKSTQISQTMDTLTDTVTRLTQEFNHRRDTYSEQVEPVNKTLRELEEKRQEGMKKILGDLSFLESVSVARVLKHVGTGADFISVVDTENDVRDFSAEILTDDPELTTSMLPRNTLHSSTLRFRKGDNLTHPWITSEVALTAGALYIIGVTKKEKDRKASLGISMHIPLAEGPVQISAIDDTYFQTSWCFQVISGKSEGAPGAGAGSGKRLVMNFAAASSGERDLWICMLRMNATCCTKCLNYYSDGSLAGPGGAASPLSAAGSPGLASPTLPSPASATSAMSVSLPGIGTVRSLQLWVTEAKDLVGPSSGKCSTYCIVLFNDLKQARTCVKTGLSPFWGEEYRFCDIPPCKTKLRLIVFQSSSSQKDHEIGYVSINLTSLRVGKRHEDWYPIKAFGKSADEGTSTAGSIRISYTLQTLYTLPNATYAPFIEKIIDPSQTPIHAIAPHLSQERDEFSKTLLNVLIAHSLQVDAIQSLTASEIAGTEDPNIIFRGNSIATKLLDHYMKMIGMTYLHGTVARLVQGIYDSRESCEVDPSKITGGRAGERAEDQIKRRWKRLMTHVNAFWDAISTSAEKCPIELVLIFSSMRSELKAKFKDDRYVWAGVSGFIFLRFFCPAILSPKLFNIMPDHPDPQTLRTLTLIAKILQNLANLSEFEGKEPHMEQSNQWLIDHAPDMRHFINSISSMSPKAASKHIKPRQPFIDLRRDAATLHNYYAQRLPEILASPKYSQDAIILSLQTDVESISKIIKSKEMDFPTRRPERPTSLYDLSFHHSHDGASPSPKLSKRNKGPSPTGSIASLEQRRELQVPRISVSMPPVRLKSALSGSRSHLRPKSMMANLSSDQLESSEGVGGSTSSLSGGIPQFLSHFGIGHGNQSEETPFLEYRDSFFSDCQPLGPKSSRENTQKKSSVDISEERRSSVASDMSVNSTSGGIVGGHSKLSLFRKRGEDKERDKDKEKSSKFLMNLLGKGNGSRGEGDKSLRGLYSSNASLGAGCSTSSLSPSSDAIPN
ncbi:hypothetical protein HDU97_002701 [Phlyctochytrium planicorne]|nr:hypothetical protein HDU97_002701 [Phlyctochytrium planicorne]